jgi:hypothetical protein
MTLTQDALEAVRRDEIGKAGDLRDRRAGRDQRRHGGLDELPPQPDRASLMGTNGVESLRVALVRSYGVERSRESCE